jgi:hypothetical protein
LRVLGWLQHLLCEVVALLKRSSNVCPDTFGPLRSIENTPVGVNAYSAVDKGAASEAASDPNDGALLEAEVQEAVTLPDNRDGASKSGRADLHFFGRF